MAKLNRSDAARMDRRAFLIGSGATVASSLAPRRAAALDDPAYRTTTDLVAALADRQVSARMLVDAAIARIEALDPKINAVVVRDFDRARNEADAADAALARGERRPLLGIPVTVKEQFNVRGLPTTWGLEQFRAWRPEEDALAVQRLKAAGAIVVGKTNVPVRLSDWQSYNPVYGSTNNPWDLSRTPGGSSGGSAAALAAGFVSLELGSDIGGSLRAPAHFCGVFSHKPSLELIPTRGTGFPGTPANPVPQGDMSVIGPMARSARDLTLALGILAGPDPRWAGIGYSLTLPPPRRERLADFRILVLDEHPLCPTAASIKGTLAALADELGRAGCTVLRRHQDMPNLAVTTRTYHQLLLSFFSLDLPPEVRVRVAAQASVLSPENQSLPASELRGLTMTHPAWIATTRIRDGLRARWQALLQDVDVILCPPMPTVAFPHDHSVEHEKRRLDIDGRSTPYGNQIAWAAIATMCGFPATIAPIGKTEAGLPIGVQIIGGYLQDLTTIKFAEFIGRDIGTPRLAG